MNVTTALFDRWKAAKGITSDRAALKALGLSSGAAVHWRNGREAGADVIEKLATDLGDDPIACVFAAMANQTQGEASRTWRRWARRFGAAAAVAWLAVAMPYDVHASTGANAEPKTVGCIMRKVAAFIRGMFGWSHGPDPVLA